MILVITSEFTVPNETTVINQMFGEGLDVLHVRKPLISRNEMIDFLCKIDEAFYPRLALHTHHDLGKDNRISRIHYREADRKEKKYKPCKDGKNIISTSVHDISAYNTLEKEWEYAFISPFFPSISKKGYGENSMVMKNIGQRNNPDVKLIALGGIHPDNIQQVLETGVDGVALLGAIWGNDNPLSVFKQCLKL
ncbi:thiamine phosphate synthase [Chryseobacterium sp.]|uniref:thiamine phosphate synthase n=1 Tax=Chryseobacterium sp. TaxID=1871047 RepID=UPI0025B83D01|nr:thiamine phosphate synthase [Chryseobacterium sp.]MBV8325890.1 thiamine phosphate synthase [Chryseobacterium sp.]